MKNWFSYFTRDMKFRTRLILTMLILVIIPIAIVTIMFFNRFTGILQDNILTGQETAAQKTANDVENLISSLMLISESIYTSNTLHNTLTTSQSELEEMEPDSAFWTSLETFQAMSGSFVTEENSNINSIKVYFDGQWRTLNPSGSDESLSLFAPLSEIQNAFWKSTLDVLNSTTLVASSYYLSADERGAGNGLGVFRRMSYFLDGNYHDAYIAVYGRSGIIEEYLYDALTSEGAVAYIINQKDYIVAYSDSALTGQHMTSFSDLEELAGGAGKFVLTQSYDSEVYLRYQDISGTDWRLVWIVPTSSMLAESRQMSIQFVVSYVLLVLLACILGIAVSATILSRINSLREHMSGVRTENPLPLELEPGKDEIGELIETYNYMVRRINALVDERLLFAEELNSVKLQALRAQIDPHFLYNTLDMIQWMSRAGDAESVSEAVLALSRFYRLTLNSGNLTTTVANEIEHVTLYVRLINMRSGNRIEFWTDLPDEMLEEQIPAIIFQPIVENSILHGIFEKPSKQGSIMITGWMDANTLNFIVADDGAGMSSKQLAGILKAGAASGKSSGIGSYNTHRRLQLFYQDNAYGLSYSDAEGGGVEVQFTLPRRGSGEQRQNKE